MEFLSSYKVSQTLVTSVLKLHRKPAKAGVESVTRGNIAMQCLGGPTPFFMQEKSD